ncbi:unnamed protein product [Ambrosiozyma monospora]|uniref:Unnamed protein product n=1 Tax=Ambrosiozyma monospora TaxID=43982 RepID=A0A9W6YXM0_AMBMO|nr:unnamed protein product [Ambrosiozyma monospora]
MEKVLQYKANIEALQNAINDFKLRYTVTLSNLQILTEKFSTELDHEAAAVPSDFDTSKREETESDGESEEESEQAQEGQPGYDSIYTTPSAYI